MPNIFMPSSTPSTFMNTDISDHHHYHNQLQIQLPHHLNTGCTYLNDANKAFDDVVFDILKVDPEDIAGQLTLIDVPLFKAIEPDELISCKWMSREKLIKAPNIVKFTRRFNQTTFWCQKEILNCKRIETRGKMIMHFIKIAKRLNELHSFNSLMAIVVALKAAPIHRLKKTWTQHVNKRDLNQFERMADIMFDTSDNKRKIRDMHMNVKLPCIPFLGLFLTDLIHIDIAHPHNSFDNPQRRNQMNNICRLISEFQQSNYQDLTSLSCACYFSTPITSSQNSPTSIKNNNNLVVNNNHISCNNNDKNLNSVNNNQISEDFVNNNINTDETSSNGVCLVTNCSCAIHHGSTAHGGGIINSDGTIYIGELSYVKNYLNSFLYIEELQKFKEDENYRDSLELEPDPETNSSSNNSKQVDSSTSLPVSLHFSSSSPSKLQQTSNLNVNTNNFLPNNLHRKTHSLVPSPQFINPLDDSVDLNNTATCMNNIDNNGLHLAALPNLNLNKEQQKHLLNSVKLNDPPSLLKELLKHRHNNSFAGTTKPNLSTQSHGIKNKFNCYSSSSADVDDDDDDEYDDLRGTTICNPVNDTTATFDSCMNESNDNNFDQVDHKLSSTPLRTVDEFQFDNNERRLSGRNLMKSLNFEQQIPGPIVTSGALSMCYNSLIQFESPIKRKCIIKNYRKPRFSQWKSYWLQLVGGNLLIYYPAKSIVFNRSQSESNSPTPVTNLSSSSSSSRRNSTSLATTNEATIYEQQVSDDSSQSTSQQSQQLSNAQILSSQLQHKKVNYHKNPCKMHPISSWMVVNLFQDKENEIMAALGSNQTPAPHYTKFDIQLNDLTNGNMYKYRFDNLKFAKEWYEQLKLASTYHERLKPDNLIRFD